MAKNLTLADMRDRDGLDLMADAHHR
ncbi:hypothetical protein CCACVL1_12580 [Corchorus capsularis]|uniref:Uncharacterized protein n=1 Tax=Corchorus capsularis TaxID=210143 RepID=A0A1R3IEY1_COCAP|nr:hypothetical protein CCACVL1_12580 [Corchorus capsularis]